jgi:hypothetical protein
MKHVLLKYVPPLAVALLFSAIYHNPAFSAVVAALAFAFTYFDFFQDGGERSKSLGGKILAYVVLGAFLGATLAFVIGHQTALFGLIFNLFLCAGFGCMLPQMVKRQWNSR